MLADLTLQPAGRPAGGRFKTDSRVQRASAARRPPRPAAQGESRAGGGGEQKGWGAASPVFSFPSTEASPWWPMRPQVWGPREAFSRQLSNVLEQLHKCGSFPWEDALPAGLLTRWGLCLPVPWEGAWASYRQEPRSEPRDGGDHAQSRFKWHVEVPAHYPTPPWGLESGQGVYAPTSGAWRPWGGGQEAEGPHWDAGLQPHLGAMAEDPPGQRCGGAVMAERFLGILGQAPKWPSTPSAACFQSLC